MLAWQDEQVHGLGQQQELTMAIWSCVVPSQHQVVLLQQDQILLLHWDGGLLVVHDQMLVLAAKCLWHSAKILR